MLLPYTLHKRFPVAVRDPDPMEIPGGHLGSHLLPQHPVADPLFRSSRRGVENYESPPGMNCSRRFRLLCIIETQAQLLIHTPGSARLSVQRHPDASCFCYLLIVFRSPYLHMPLKPGSLHLSDPGFGDQRVFQKGGMQIVNLMSHHHPQPLFLLLLSRGRSPMDCGGFLYPAQIDDVVDVTERIQIVCGDGYRQRKDEGRTGVSRRIQSYQGTTPSSSK